MARPFPFLRLLPLLLLAPLPFLTYGASQGQDPERQDSDRVGKVRWQDRTWLRVDARANTHTSSKQDEPSLARAADGSLTLVWQSRRQQNASDGVYAQRFARDGAFVDSETTLNTWQTTDQNQPAIACSADVTWTAWQSQGQDGEGSGVYLRRLDRSGETRISESPKGDQYGVVLAAADRGGVTAAWISAEVGRTVARLRHFDRAGRPVGKEVELGEARGVTIATHDRKTVVVWQDPHRGLLARNVDGHATPQGNPRLISEPGKTAIEPSICNTAGGFAVAWMSLDDAGTQYDVKLRRLDAQAVPEGPAMVVTSNKAWNSGACVTAFKDGSLVVAWNEEALATDASRVVLRIISVEGELGKVYEVGKGRLRIADGRPALLAGPDKSLALAWAGDASLGDRSGVHLTLLLPDADRSQHMSKRASKSTHVVASAGDRADPQLLPWQRHAVEAEFVTELAAPQGQHIPPVYEKPDPLLANWGKGPSIQAAGGDRGFAAFSTGFRKLTPPDPHMACGPDHVVSIVNAGIGFWKKDGTRTFLAGFNGTGGFWTGVGGTGFVFDPEVHWDPHAKRFIAMANERNGTSSYFLIAISDDTDPNGTWHKYRVDVTAVGGSQIDSPNLGIDDKALYLTADMYGTKRQYLIYIMDKKPLLAGLAPGTATSTKLTRFSAGLPVIWGTTPTMYMIQHETTSSITIYAIKNSLTTPTLVSTSLTVPQYTTPTSLTQKGTTRRITTFNPRFWSCVWRNGSLWACHHHGNPVKARWYEIQTGSWPTAGQPKILQQGDISLGSGKHAAFNSIAVDESNNALMTFASCSPNDYLSIARTWRAASDPLGTMRPTVYVKSNTQSYTGSRWGDYSGAAADPARANTIWYTHELAPTSSWTTWIGSKTTAILGTDVDTLPAATGGTVNFELDNPSQAGKPYLIIGTLSGTNPGFKLGSLQVPINIDSFTTLALALASSPVFTGFFGTLDADGNASASMTLPPIPGLIGKTMHFAFVQDFTTWTFASPATPVSIK